MDPGASRSAMSPAFEQEARQHVAGEHGGGPVRGSYPFDDHYGGVWRQLEKPDLLCGRLAVEDLEALCPGPHAHGPDEFGDAEVEFDVVLQVWPVRDEGSRSADPA
jgi:hypothetical protein